MEAWFPLPGLDLGRWKMVKEGCSNEGAVLEQGRGGASSGACLSGVQRRVWGRGERDGREVAATQGLVSQAEECAFSFAFSCHRDPGKTYEVWSDGIRTVFLEEQFCSLLTHTP